MTWLWVSLAFVGGTIFGVVIMCCLIVASDEDKRLEKFNVQDADSE